VLFETAGPGPGNSLQFLRALYLIVMADIAFPNWLVAVDRGSSDRLPSINALDPSSWCGSSVTAKGRAKAGLAGLADAERPTPQSEPPGKTIRRSIITEDIFGSEIQRDVALHNAREIPRCIEGDSRVGR
jgi:hypothetical protein